MPTPNPIELSETDILYMKLKWLDSEGCWEWEDWNISRGYGALLLENGQQVLAHRVSLTVAEGDHPPDKPYALHQCDNPRCYNPKHLRWGSHAENMGEAKARGRFPSKAKNFCVRGHAMEGDNLRLKTFVSPEGHTYYNRLCRMCANITQQARRARRKLSILNTQ